ncbi:hypothetical protein BVC80_1605g52 [Macleaya cordata]|uniref:Uncharacterized protein n=1 Tax=Macleaya cordata TaxID=56857 RepID=A0A200QA87_MACCD|nr:hypothetical protein BVC80_1605g52 [Macleaya cordata]
MAAEALTSVLVEHLATVFIQKIEQHVRLAMDAKDEGPPDENDGNYKQIKEKLFYAMTSVLG